MKTLRIYCEASGCKKTFRNQASLDNHVLKDHSNSKTTVHFDFKCPSCFKSLSTKQSLKEHLYTHSGEKPYKCLEAGCGLLFRQSSQLSNHKKVHLEIKKNAPELSKINLVLLSKLFAKEDYKKTSIPTGPLTYEDIYLPQISPTSTGVLRIIDGHSLFKIEDNKSIS
ncbi:hypothetical protein SteCoe_2341 [Stentor coeruleus]|uniref:C2H2-type domain-containing protein n=1 Tax=Stentor coeruleus TaxID=5963 RepID=A0A1R2CZN7_9CILI|nr:hypothetical protein SteCoe_2341 [Stentor coeruleus]